MDFLVLQSSCLDRERYFVSLKLGSCCCTDFSVLLLFLVVLWVGLLYVIVAFSGHMHVLFHYMDIKNASISL